MRKQSYIKKHATPYIHDYVHVDLTPTDIALIKSSIKELQKSYSPNSEICFRLVPLLEVLVNESEKWIK